MQAVVVIAAVHLRFCIGKSTALRGADAMPCKRFSRADDGCAVNRIYMVHR